MGPTISLASVATGAEEDDDQSDSDYGKNVNWIYHIYSSLHNQRIKRQHTFFFIILMDKFYTHINR